jgi:hypothetical protein
LKNAIFLHQILKNFAFRIVFQDIINEKVYYMMLHSSTTKTIRNSFSVISYLLTTLFFTFTTHVNAQLTETLSSTGSSSWTVPVGVSGDIVVKVWSAGGSGGGVTGGGKTASGGTGGTYVTKTYVDGSYTAGVTTFDLYVAPATGTTATGANGANGAASWFENTSTVFAPGGKGGLSSGGNVTALTTGAIPTAGAVYALGTTSSSGSAGANGGGNGGTTVAPTNNNSEAGGNGTSAGGGGGGGRTGGGGCNGCAATGGSGARGEIQITYTCGINAGTASASEASVTSCNETVTLSLTDHDDVDIQWQWSPNNSTWYSINGATTATIQSPYISRATVYFRAKLSIVDGCEVFSNVLTITSSSATACYFWEGNTSTQWATGSNWSSGVKPSTTNDVFIPAGTTYNATVSNTTGPANAKNLTVQSGALMYYNSTVDGNGLFVYGNLHVEENGEIDDWLSNYYVHMEGGSSTDYATISGPGKMPYALSIGYNQSSHYRLENAINITWFSMPGTNSPAFDMNDFDFGTNLIIIGAGSKFYQRSGELRIEGTTSTIDDIAFEEGTGTTFFSSGTRWIAKNQTIPSLSYYNLKVRSNNNYTATLGSGSSFVVANDLTLINPHNAGGLIRTTTTSAGTSITVNRNLYIGHDGVVASGNAFTLTLQSCRVKNNNNNGVIYMSDNDDHLINLSRESATAINFQGFVDPVFYGTVNYNRSGDQTITTATYKHLTLSNSGDKTLSGSIDVVGNLTIGTTTSLLSSTHTIDIGGDWINNGNFVANGQTVTFNGSTNQSIEGSATETNFYNLTNQKVGGELILSQDIKVTSILEMAGSDIDLNGQVIDLNGTGTINGESNSDRIKGSTGYITSTIASVNAPSNLNIGGMGAVLSSPANLGTTTISRGHTRQTGIHGNLGIERYYIISPTNNSGIDATLQAEYFANDVPAGYIESQFALYRSADGGATWAVRYGDVNASGGEKGSVTLAEIDQFSIWTISDSQAQPLPVKMTAFVGECFENYVSLFWQTASEQNCSYFDIERSSNGFDWSVLGDLEGNGNSTSLKNYEWKDEYPSRGSITYYRLRQVDFDGEEEIYGPISVTCDENSGKLRLEVFPNPTLTNATVLFSWDKGASTGLAKVFDASGKIIQYKPITVLNGTNAVSVNLSNQPNGIYFIDLEINDAPQGMLKVLKQ